MHTLIVMDRSGHTEVAWCPDLEAAVEEANRTFNDMQSLGYTGFEMTGTRTGEQIREFNPNAEKIVMIPPMVGG